ncbi:MAG: 2,3-oxidosqualene cyclase [Myxococcales bacterium]|nr:2,3-oxidosqualene cyclase [Myxococcales bacterium]
MSDLDTSNLPTRNTKTRRPATSRKTSAAMGDGAHLDSGALTHGLDSALGVNPMVRALENARAALEAQQRPAGDVAGEVVWCAMIPAQVILTSHLIRRPLPPERLEALARGIEHEQLDDGGFPLYDGGKSYLYVSVLAYVALRLAGRDPEHAACARARRFLAGDDVASVPTWGKLWLAMMGLYGWEGVNPIPPEIWLLPTSAPMHPRRFYNHTRLIYLGFSYLYGVRFQGPETPVVAAIRAELYPGGFERVGFAAYRSRISARDRFVPVDPVLEATFAGLVGWEKLAPDSVRARALAVALGRIVWETRASRHVGLSPVNGLLNVLALHHAGHSDADAAWAGVDYWAWEDGRGRRVAGASSNTWDSAFAARALTSGPLTATSSAMLSSFHRFFGGAQALAEVEADGPIAPLATRESCDRMPITGGFCFGDPTHRWPVSDCTAEALSAIVAIEGLREVDVARLPDERVALAVRFILDRQNADGGFSSYEPARGGRLLEKVNPSEMFGNCMGEYSYLECTSSCVQGLSHVLAARTLEAALGRRVSAAIERGVDYISRCQRPDGGFEAFWGVNFTYATWFAIAGLRAAGRAPHDPRISRAVAFLLAHRHADGGWGEDAESCITHEWVKTPSSQVIMTSWAMLALMESGLTGGTVTAALETAASLLIQRQQPDGFWPRERVAGIFFDTAGLHYDLYRLYFPLWALNRFAGSRGTDRAT